MSDPRGTRRSTRLAAAVAAVALLAGGYALYRLGLARGMQMAATSAASGTAAGAPQKPGDLDPATGKRVLYWHDPMVPGQRFDAPGKSPFMNMPLVAVHE